MTECLGMRHWRASSQFFGVCLLFGLGQGAAFAQGNHLGALREWLRYTEDAANFLNKGDYVKAEQRLNLAIKEIRPFLPDTRHNMARSYCELARVLYHQKRYADAEPLAKWALSVRESDKKARPESVFQCVYTFALIQSALKHHGEAESLFKRSLALQEENLGPDHINSNLILNQLATVYVEQEKYTDAEPLYVRSIAIHERKNPAENLDLAETAEKYAALLRLMNRSDDAARWNARARSIRDTVAAKEARARADRFADQFKGFK
jgi:tetratricopeptide (TPR) repeat protein